MMGKVLSHNTDQADFFSSPEKKTVSAFRISRLYSNSIYLMLNSGAGAGLGFFYWFIAARVAPAEQVGIGSALVSASGLLAFFGSLGLGYGLIRFVPKSSTPASLINTALTSAAISTATLSAIFVFGLPLWNHSLAFVGHSPGLGLAFVVLVTMIGTMGLANQAFISLRRAEFSLAQTVAFGLLKIGLVLGLASLFQAFGIFASWGLGAAVAVLLSLLLLLPRLQPGYRPFPTLTRRAGEEMFRFSLANYVADGLWNSSAWLLPLITAALLGGEANAYFYVTWSLAGLLYTIPMSTSLSLFAESSHREEMLGHNLRRGLRLVTMLVLPALALELLLGGRLLSLYGAGYAKAGTGLLRLLALAVFPLSVNAAYVGVMRVHRRLKETVLLVALIAAVTLVSGVILIPRLGIIGAGFGWLAGQTLACAYTLPRILKFARQPVENTNTEGSGPGWDGTNVIKSGGHA